MSYFVLAILLTVSSFALAATDAQFKVKADGRYYEILEVDRDATPEQIKVAYRLLTKKYHPDRNSSEASHDKFVEVLNAYKILSDPDKRADYDFLTRKQFSTQQVKNPKTVDPVSFDFLMKSPEQRILWLLSQDPEVWNLRAAQNIRTAYWQNVSEKDFLVSLVHFASLYPNLRNAILGAEAKDLLIGRLRAAKYCQNEMTMKDRY